MLWLSSLTCKNEDDPIKTEGTRVLTRLYFNFSDTQGQLTPQSLVESGQNSNSCELLWLSLLLAKMKKIQLKMKALECIQHFSHYKPMGFFSDAQGQLTPQSLVESGRISNSSEMLWLSSLPARIEKIRSK